MTDHVALCTVMYTRIYIVNYKEKIWNSHY